jgi:hypothetical protein
VRLLIAIASALVTSNVAWWLSIDHRRACASSGARPLTSN